MCRDYRSCTSQSREQQVYEMIVEFVLFLSFLVFLLYSRFKSRFKFWKNLNVPYLEPYFPFGNVSGFLDTSLHFSHVIEGLYKRLKKQGAVDYGGIYFFGNPVFLVLSPEFAKTVLVRDFNHFHDRGIYFNEEVDKLSANIFFLRGQKWKKLREKLSPTFSSGKIKQMFFTILDVGQRLETYLMPFASENSEIEMRDVLGRFMTDVIASCAFGLETDCINDQHSSFREMGRNILKFPKSKALKLIFASTFQKQARLLGVRWNDVDVSEFFMNVVKDTIEYRRTSNTRRNDFMQLLIDMMQPDEKQEGLNFDEIAAQAFVFFFAG